MIDVPYIRSSMNGTWTMCKMKFYLSYILGWSEPSNLKADKGTIVHKVMEILANVKLAQQENKFLIVDDVVGEIGIREIYKEGSIDYVIDTVYNYYAKAYNHHDWTNDDHKEVVKWIHKALNYNNGEFDPLNQNIVKAEQHFKLTLNEEWAKGVELTGTIDLIVKNDENTIEIIDYKTGARTNWSTGKTKEYGDFLKDFQLRYYHLACSMLYPNVDNILITIYYINSGGPYTIALDRSDLPETIKNVRALYEEIKNTEIPEIRRGFHCRFCDFSKSTFENTNVPVMINNGQFECNFTSKGEAMKKCDSMRYFFAFRDIDSITANASREDYKNEYKPPGQT